MKYLMCIPILLLSSCILAQSSKYVDVNNTKYATPIYGTSTSPPYNDTIVGYAIELNLDTGKYLFVDENKNIFIEGNYNVYGPNGSFKYFSKTKQLIKYETWKNGKKDGFTVKYNVDGSIMEVDVYENGLLKTTLFNTKTYSNLIHYKDGEVIFSETIFH